MAIRSPAATSSSVELLKPVAWLIVDKTPLAALATLVVPRLGSLAMGSRNELEPVPAGSIRWLSREFRLAGLVPLAGASLAVVDTVLAGFSQLNLGTLDIKRLPNLIENPQGVGLGRWIARYW